MAAVICCQVVYDVNITFLSIKAILSFLLKKLKTLTFFGNYWFVYTILVACYCFYHCTEQFFKGHLFVLVIIMTYFVKDYAKILHESNRRRH